MHYAYTFELRSTWSIGLVQMNIVVKSMYWTTTEAPPNESEYGIPFVSDIAALASIFSTYNETVGCD